VSPPAIDRSRYLRLRRYLARLFLHLVWFDLVLSQPVLRHFRSPPLRRWATLARDYRSLAVELGGVLIKLGQYLSTRVDVFPAEITRELSGLQDQVPAVPFPEVARRIEEDFGRPVTELFASIDSEPAGAASLAQAHRAVTAAGEGVVVKVLRPGIERLVETDLAAVKLAIRWLRPWRRVRRRVDLDRLFDEFAGTTRSELDMEREAANAERFAELFRDDPGILVPRVHPELTARHTLTLEDVGYLRIADLEAIEAAGVSLGEVARRLYRAYMEQLFVHHFVHCDPHPGNLFVRPLGPDEEGAGGEAGRPFQIAFVDFGMMSAIPERLWAALSEVVIAAGTRDARRLVRAYRDAGVLLPEADLARLEEIHRDLFDRFWGLKLSELQGVAQSQAPHLIWQYRDVVYQAPVQFPVDLLFTFRALGILTGMATTLDPELDPWAETLPFAKELAKESLGEAARRAFAELTEAGGLLLRLPAGLERTLALAEGEGVRVRAELADDDRRVLRRIGRAGTRLAWTIAASALLLAGLQLELARPGSHAAVALWIAAGGAFLWGLVRK
jgi:predicted unusual protein kinase regulating ubiquinone biosynthesis (AarF/ABC1/UbiB family)